MDPKEKEKHLKFMREALAMAEYALLHAETPVGCIFVHSPTSTILSRGYNHTNQTYNGTRHAEFVAVNEILASPIPASFPITNSNSTFSNPASTNPSSSISNTCVLNERFTTEIFKECDLYVTVEPCIMCASFLRQLGVKRVFFGAGNEKFGGTGGVLNIQCENGRWDSFLERRGDDAKTKEAYDVEDMGRGDGGNRERKSWEEGDGRQGKGWEEGDYEVSGGWLREEAIVMLRRFYVQENGRAPEEKRGKEGRVLRLDVEPLGVGGI